MADHFPLIIDTSDGNKIKELPAGDNLDLSQSNIVNVAGITTLGTVNVGTLQINGNALGAAAISNNYNDLNNRPVIFSGDYTDLTNKPIIPTHLSNISDVSLTQPTDGQGLVWSDADNQWVPADVDTVDLSNYNITQLNDVIITGTVENKYLKFYAGAWRPANVTWTEIQSRPVFVSEFVNDQDYATNADVNAILEQNPVRVLVGSVFADDSSLVIDGITKEVFTPKVTTDQIDSEGTLLVTSGDITLGGLLRLNANAETLATTGGEAMELQFDTTFTGNITVNGNVSIGGTVETAIDAKGGVTGDLRGSVFADDSSLIVDSLQGKLFAPIDTIKGDIDTITGPGTISVESLTTTGTDTYSLPNGTPGQIKIIVGNTGSGTATFTPATFGMPYTDFVFAGSFGTAMLVYTSSGWVVVSGQDITYN